MGRIQPSSETRWIKFEFEWEGEGERRDEERRAEWSAGNWESRKVIFGYFVHFLDAYKIEFTCAPVEISLLTGVVLSTVMLARPFSVPKPNSFTLKLVLLIQT